eukprot:COSAG06_NODE_8083_length_2277_cov_1.331956_3_plen_411_part_00
MSLRPMSGAPGVRVDGASGRPISARRGKTVQERRAEIVAANARLKSQLARESGGSGSTDVYVRPSADPELRTLETQRDTLRAQLRQLTGVLASRRDELEELRGGVTAPAASLRANGPHGHSQEFVPGSPASGRAPSDLDDSDYTELDFANDAAVAAAQGWGDESALLPDDDDDDGDWRDDMMSVISRDKREAERGSSRSLLSVDLGGAAASGDDAKGADARGRDSGGGSGGSGSGGGGNGGTVAVAAVAVPAAVSGAAAVAGAATESCIPVTVAVYDWSEGVQSYQHSSSTRIMVDLLEQPAAATGGGGALQLSPAEAFYASVQRVAGWDVKKHGEFRISDCVASDGPAPTIFGSAGGGEGEGEGKGGGGGGAVTRHAAAVGCVHGAGARAVAWMYCAAVPTALCCMTLT